SPWDSEKPSPSSSTFGSVGSQFAGWLPLPVEPLRSMPPPMPEPDELPEPSSSNSELVAVHAAITRAKPMVRSERRIAMILRECGLRAAQVARQADRPEPSINPPLSTRYRRRESTDLTPRC